MTQQRGHGFQTDSINSKKSGNTYLMVVAIDQYHYKWPDLGFPVWESKQLIELLTEKYGVTLDPIVGGFITNEFATHKSVRQKLYKLREKNPETNEYLIGNEDSLVLIFSGHGFQDSNYPDDPGYLAMTDSGVPTLTDYDLLTGLINGDELVNILSHVQAKHILVIVDSCFSSSFSKRHITLPNPIQPKKGKKSSENPSRWIMTSGRNELVPDKSLFARALISELTENHNFDISVRGLFSKIEQRLKPISCPSPLLDDLVVKEFNGGEFRFFQDQLVTKSGVAYSRGGNLNSDKDELVKALRLGSSKYKDQLHKGRFQHLNIAQVLLAETDLPEMEEAVVSMDNNLSYLSKAVSSLWEKEKRHVLLIGSGGMGKTVSLLNLWSEFLENESLPIPLFIGLNEFNQIIREEDKIGFIFRYLSRHYLGKRILTSEFENELWDLFTKESGTKHPGIVLLLDGFNEVTAKKDLLVSDLNEIVSKAINVQLIVSSRYVEIQQYHWTRSSTPIDLVPLATVRIERYLKNVGGKIPANSELINLLGNPMMLAIYASTDSIITKYFNDSRFTFHSVQTVAELLWNFQEAHLAKNLEALEGNETEQVYFTFLTRYLVPFLAWRMEKEGQFFVTSDIAQNIQFNFNSLIGEACRYLSRRGALAVYPKIVSIPQRLTLKELKDDEDDLLRSDTIQETLVRNLHIMVAEGNELRFLHQNFRDFYAACHLRNSILFSLAEDSLPLEWKERVLPVYLRKMLGEIEGEYLFDPYVLLEGANEPKRITYNLISKLLDACRGHEMDEDFTVWNLVTILNEARTNLGLANLSNLDLRKIYFNQFFFTVRKGKQYGTANLHNSKVDSKQLLSNSHVGYITSSTYSFDSKKILTTSFDKTIKEWSITGECLNTLKGHKAWVKFAIYSPDGLKIISVANDDIMKLWHIESGICLKTFPKNNEKIKHIVFSPDSEKILITFNNGSFIEYCVESEECGNIINTHEKGINSAIYNPLNQNVVTGSFDGIIREWSLGSSACVRTINTGVGISSIMFNNNGNKILLTHHDGIFREFCYNNENCIKVFSEYQQIRSAVYSPDEKKILSASTDGTIREMIVETGECITNIFADRKGVVSCKYDLTGQRILATNGDGTVSEWLTQTGERNRLIRPQSRGINSGEYSYNSKRYLLASNDGTVREWSSMRGVCVNAFMPHNDEVNMASYKNNKIILSASRDGIIKESSRDTGECIKMIKGHSSSINSVVYSSDFKRILSASNDKSVKEFLVETGECLRVFDKFNRTNIFAVFSPNQDKILFVSNDRAFREWSIKNDEIKVFDEHAEWVTAASYNNDGNIIISASDDCTIKQWSVKSGKSFMTFNAHGKNISSLVLSPDKSKILTASFDQTVKEWSVETGSFIRVFDGHNGAVAFANYSPDGTKVISSSDDGEIKEWFVETAECLKTVASEIGLFTQGLDLRHLHSDSKFTEEEKDRLRRYGAIFDDEDERIWKDAITDAYGDEA